MLNEQDHCKLYPDSVIARHGNTQKKQEQWNHLKQKEVGNSAYINYTSKHAFISSQSDRTYDARIHNNSIPGMITDQEKIELIHSHMSMFGGHIPVGTRIL